MLRTTMRALEGLAHGADRYIGGEIIRVDLVRRGSKKKIDPNVGCKRSVPLLVAWVSIEVPRIVELSGVDEQRDDHQVAVGPSAAHEREMAVVKCAHGGHQTNLQTTLARLADNGPGLGHGANDLHAAALVGSGARLDLALARSSSVPADASALCRLGQRIEQGQ